MSFFNVANRATFSSVFGARMFEPKEQEALRADVYEMILGHIRMPATAG